VAALYNERDPDAAAVLRVLIAEGLIAPGVVDERSIEDVLPDELAGYTQVHLFAGFGIWSLALRQAGVSDDTQIWTCSCPCQPFSEAGKGLGFADKRHLWPSAYHLISQCRPPEILGEQVAAKAVEPWIDLVHADLEALGYAFGCVPFPSAGVGAPHIRDRAYWSGKLANANDTGLEGRTGMPERTDQCFAGPDGLAFRLADTMQPGRPERRASAGFGQVAGLRAAGWMGDAVGSGRQPITNVPGGFGEGVESTRRQPVQSGKAVGDAGRLDNARPDHDAGEVGAASAGQSEVHGPANITSRSSVLVGAESTAGPTNGLWRTADWLLCRDGKWRPVEPGTFPLAHAGTFRNRVAALRGAGNAINVEAAKVWIETVMETTP
jgi:DNA (cytosine-5)-methyltransferase 1